MREEFLLSAARRALQDAPEADKARFEQMIRELCDDPSLGSPVGTLLDSLPARVFRYNDRGFVVVYDLPDAATLRVWGISRALTGGGTD